MCEKPIVKLVGEDGNVFSILSKCALAAKASGWPDENVKAFLAKCFKMKNYQEILAYVDEQFIIE